MLTQSMGDLAFTHRGFCSDIDGVASLDEKRTVRSVQQSWNASFWLGVVRLDDLKANGYLPVVLLSLKSGSGNHRT